MKILHLIKTPLLLSSRYKVLLTYIAISSLFFVEAAFAAVIPANCTNALATDTTAVRTAISNAIPGDTVLIQGTCQLNGSRIFINTSDITITGDRVDDGDGIVGATDTWNTVLRGSTNPVTGLPLGNAFSFALNGPTVSLSDGVIKNVTIKNIKFEDIARPIRVDPQVGSVSGNFTVGCADIAVGSGSTSGVVIKDNWFYHTERAVQSFGNSENLLITNNLVDIYSGTAVTGFGLVTDGTAIACSPPAGGIVLFPLPGIPINPTIVGNKVNTTPSTVFGIVLTSGAKNIVVTDNVVNGPTGPTATGLEFTGITKGLVKNNTITHNGLGGARGVSMGSDIQMKVLNNTISEWTVGIRTTDTPFAVLPNFSSSQVLVGNNVIKNSSTGYLAIGKSTGFTATNNVFEGNTLDVSLDATTFSNTIISNNFAITVTDLGTANRLLGTLKLLNNDQVPQEVKDRLINDEVGRPLEL